jgi:16S rRNA (guanine527-N7)-methyltransferase
MWAEAHWGPSLTPITEAIRARAGLAGLVELPDEVVRRVAEYFGLLAHWNRRVNLTGFDLDSWTEAAVDRLLIEPLWAASRLLDKPRTLLDVGSGGGSPGIPFAIGLQQDPLVLLVEARSRKATFLREALRVVGLPGGVAAIKFEELAHGANGSDRFDMATMRAVRPDQSIWDTLSSALQPSGRVVWFHGPAQGVVQHAGLTSEETVRIGGNADSWLTTLVRAP